MHDAAPRLVGLISFAQRSEGSGGPLDMAEPFELIHGLADRRRRHLRHARDVAPAHPPLFQMAETQSWLARTSS
jgi:hypothetical protein